MVRRKKGSAEPDVHKGKFHEQDAEFHRRYSDSDGGDEVLEDSDKPVELDGVGCEQQGGCVPGRDLLMIDDEHNELGGGGEDDRDEDKVDVRDKRAEDGGGVEDRRDPVRFLIGF